MEIIEISYANRKGYLIFEVQNNLTIGGARDAARDAIIKKFGDGPQMFIDEVESRGDKRWHVRFHTNPKTYSPVEYIEAILSAGFELVHPAQLAYDIGGFFEDFGVDSAAGLRNKSLWLNSRRRSHITVPAGLDETGLELFILENSEEFKFEGDPGVVVEKLVKSVTKLYNDGV